MDVVTADARWEVLLSTPADIGDLGLHHDADVAAAHFRRQLVAGLGAEHAQRVGPAAEQQFRRARAELEGKPVLWSGFVMVGTPAAAGLDHTLGEDAPRWPPDLAHAKHLRTLAATPAVVLISVTVGVRRFVPPPADWPVAPATLLSRALKVTYGEDARVHLVTYGDVAGVATVRPVPQTVAATSAGGLSFAADSPAAQYLLAEVALLFPEDEALVTVVAGTPNSSALGDAVLLAGSIARTVRLRSLGAGPRPPDSPLAPVR